MKVFNFKSSLAMLTFSTMSLFLQAPTQAQVNKQLLSDVIKSCQRDMSIDYFRRMGIPLSGLKEPSWYTEPSSQAQNHCISLRYYYGSVIEQFPWLPDSGEIVPGYSASVALLASVSININSSDYFYFSSTTEEKILECVTSKDFDGSKECKWTQSTGFKISDDYRKFAYWNYYYSPFLPYVCPKCVVAHDDASRSEINRGFINWFLSLDKSKRRDVVSLLSSKNIEQNLMSKARMAVQAYQDALTKIEQDEKAQRRRNLLGQ
jgi:hypothetical protein